MDHIVPHQFQPATNFFPQQGSNIDDAAHYLLIMHKRHKQRACFLPLPTQRSILVLLTCDLFDQHTHVRSSLVRLRLVRVERDMDIPSHANSSAARCDQLLHYSGIVFLFLTTAL